MFHENWYCDEQVANLCHLLKDVKNLEGDVIEIGCWEGRSTHNIANAIYPEKLICNDTWQGNIEEGKCKGSKDITEIILETRDVFQIFKNNMNILTKGNFEIVKQDCIEYLKQYNGKIKFCHIDASHEYESVYKTIELVLPKLVDGGIICGDDFIGAHKNRVDLNGGVERAVREFFPDVNNYDNLWFWKKI